MSVELKNTVRFGFKLNELSNWKNGKLINFHCTSFIGIRFKQSWITSIFHCGKIILKSSAQSRCKESNVIIDLKVYNYNRDEIRNQDSDEIRFCFTYEVQKILY